MKSDGINKSGASAVLAGESDTVQLERLSTELALAREQLEHKNRRIGELYDTAHRFMDHVSCEFRNPLAVIREFTSILHDGLAGDLSREQREYLGIISDRVDDLALMVTDILDLSRLDSGLQSVVRRAWRPDAIVDEVRQSLERRAEVCKVELAIELPPDLPEVFCDAEQIARVLVNLAVHTLKHAASGGRLQLWVRHEPDAAQVRFGVEGSGGAAWDEAVDAGCDLQTTSGGKAGDLGLGLEVGHRLVQLSFAELMAESGDEGWRLHFALPTAEPEAIARRYVASCRHLAEGGQTLSLIIAESPAVESATTEFLEPFFHHVLRRNDLVLRGPRGQWLLAVCGRAEDLDKVLARIDRAWEETSGAGSASRGSRLSLGVRGVWALADDGGEFIATLLEQFHAEQHAAA